jgi:hypothetical protein
VRGLREQLARLERELARVAKELADGSIARSSSC